MKCKIKNNSNLDMTSALPLLKSLYSFSRDQLGFEDQANILFQSDSKNATRALGKTAHYHPQTNTITVYTDGRHLKDVLRSISHELIHHDQNCRGAFDEPFEARPGYAQEDNRMRELERDAYERGNMIFRDWEDKQKWQLSENKEYKKEIPMKHEKPTKKEVIKGNEQKPQTNKPVSNDEWYQHNLYKSLMKRWVKKK
tara:strand:+ start:530 stop:1123 length:594 start_codon:yes stop_codon:yes gene_type:complete